VEDCTIWIGRLDNPAFGQSLLSNTFARLRGGERLTISGIRANPGISSNDIPTRRSFWPQQGMPHCGATWE
jgi:hypothetical protein